jgi:hypothetical protein
MAFRGTGQVPVLLRLIPRPRWGVKPGPGLDTALVFFRPLLMPSIGMTVLFHKTPVSGVMDWPMLRFPGKALFPFGLFERMLIRIFRLGFIDLLPHALLGRVGGCAQNGRTMIRAIFMGAALFRALSSGPGSFSLSII